jgi:hypothetical protein
MLALVLLAAGLAGCVGDLGPQPADTDATDDQPAETEAPDYELPDQIAGMEPATTLEHGSAGGLVIEDGTAYVSGLGSGFYTADVTDPREPEKLAHLEELYARDADTLTVDGRTHVALAAGGQGLHIVNVSDPANPTVETTEFDVGEPVHNLVTVPGTTLVYNSRSLGDATEPGIDIVDISDPANPTVEKAWTFPRAGQHGASASTGCHDITVYPDADRAYCAGVTQTYILDISDPQAPAMEGQVTNPAINIHHWAVPAQDHDLLIIGDEFAGAAAPSTCLGHASTSAGDVSQPEGGLWFYDISDPQAPVPMGFLSAPTHATQDVCTAHFGEVLPDRDQMAVGWYTAGVLLVDFSDPTTPELVDQWGQGEANVWDVRYTNGHLITGDIQRGTDVLQLVGEG